MTAHPAAAAPPNYISGSACTKSLNPVWQSADTWIMYGNVTVVPGCTLTIEPGAFVRVDPGVRLYVRGSLLANGIPGTLISFSANNTATNVPWGGVQFNATSTGSVSWSSFSEVERALHAIQSSPDINNNTIDSAYYGIQLERSSSSVYWNRINFTTVGIQASVSGSTIIADNTITNVTGNLALGIYVTNLNSVTIWQNTIRDVFAANGRTPALAGARGSDGGYAVAILVNGTSTASVYLNTISQVLAGQGGNGQSSALGNGGRGGDGGSAGGIATFSTGILDLRSNTVTNLAGGHAGNGGGSTAPVGDGGNGGNGGTAAAIDSYSSTTSAAWYSNIVNRITGGSAGDGGSASSGLVGNGGVGGDAYGFLTSQAMNGDASGNTVQSIRGGSGGNSSNGARGNYGGSGGQAAGFWAFGVDGSGTVHANTISALTGGNGGAGRPGAGSGGNVTGLFVVGDGTPFNATAVRANGVSGLIGGIGGIGTVAGGGGGSAAGFAAFHVRLTSASNTISSLSGGKGGDAALIFNPAGRGGDGSALVVALIPSGTSTSDVIQTVTKGSPGAGSGTPASYGVGVYAIGNVTIRTQLTVTNATLLGVGDVDLYVDNYTEATTVNTPFSTTKLAVESAGNLTVRNFLALTIFWPNNLTFVNGARIQIKDDANTVWDFVSPSGQAQWLLVTDRVYIDSKTNITDNATTVTVTYGSYAFWNDPRLVNMSASHTESFGMVDGLAPSSSATALPPYENARTFPVGFTYGDGNGTGVQNVSLYFRSDGGAWTKYGTVNVSGVGSFSFTAGTDGTYEFYTIATDKAGNVQAAPAGNNTWTILDTSAPGSHINALPAYETTVAFPVSWAPDAGITDILTYQIQYDAGAGWVTWLGDTTATSAVFTATGQGVYAFRSIAWDRAGNRETPPATNDTWTVVDTIPPASQVSALPTYETNVTFLVSWGPQVGSADVASYLIQVSVDGGAWSPWIASTTNLSASYSGQDGHRYAFRSLATDYAGNGESKGPANDTWTLVDGTPPSSAVATLPRYETSLTFPLSWGPKPGTTDISAYSIQVSDNGGPWTPLTGYTNSQSTGATFSGTDGHRYAFRSLARDYAGNAEAKGSANDTWTIVDVTRPYVVSTAPSGAGVNATPLLIVRFSEPMNETSVQLAFSITPGMDGSISWSSDGTLMTWQPARPLQSGQAYTYYIDSSARDLAGNSVNQPTSNQFSVAAGFSVVDLWPIFLIAAAVIGGAVLFLLRRRGAGEEGAAASASKPAPPTSGAATQAAIDDVFLLYSRDGVLIKHETRRLRPDIDMDILSGMLTAVQQFVKDSFHGEEGEELNEMTVGQMHILIGRGKYLILAATVTGGDIESMTVQIRKAVQDMEDHHWDQLEDWDGDMDVAKVLSPYVRKLIRGDYA